MKKIFLIDGDNNINLGLRGIEMLPEDNQVMIFHSKAMEITKFQKKLSGCRAKIDFIESVRAGKNSVDFQITTELGFLSNHKELEYAYIISCDKGYDAAIDYVKSRYSSKFKELERRESIFDCFQLAFVLKAKTKQELNNALVKEYGTSQGNLVYAHLKELFGDEEQEASANGVVEKAEMKVAEVQQKVQNRVEKVVAAVKKEEDPEAKVLVKDIIPAVKEEKKEKKQEREKKQARVQKKPAPSRKPPRKAEEAEEKKPTIEIKPAEEVKPELRVEEQRQEFNVPLRFGAVRTEEQNQSFFKSKDLRKKKPEAVKEEEKVSTEHVETVVGVIREAHRSQEKESEQRQFNNRRQGRRESDRRNDSRGQKPSGFDGKKEGKVVPMKPEAKVSEGERTEAREEVKPAAAASASTPARKAANQSGPGFFGRVFSRKKK